MKYLYPSFTVPAHGTPKVDKPEPPCPVCTRMLPDPNGHARVWKVCTLHRETVTGEG
jgi:hypothetical protein